MNRRFYIIIIFVFSLIWSCVPYRYIDIQVLKPAQVSWTHSIDTLFLLEAMKLEHAGKNAKEKLLYLKFLYSFNQTLTKKLKDSPLFENTNIKAVPFDYLFENYRNANFEDRKYIFTCAIQSVHIEDTTYQTEISDYYNQITCRAIYKVTLRLNDFINQKKELTIEDTVFWDSNQIYYTYDIDSVYTDKSEAYRDLGEFAAEKFTRDIAPYWFTDERIIFFASNKLMRKGYRSFVEDNQPNAIKYWQEIVESGTIRLAGMASYNIALSYETMDSLHLSKEWLVKSIKLKKDSVKSTYLKLIEKRIREREKLDEQFKLKTKQIN